MSRKLDALIVGASFSGATIALQLAQARLSKVWLMEKHFPAQGSSGTHLGILQNTDNISNVDYERIEHLQFCDENKQDILDENEAAARYREVFFPKGARISVNPAALSFNPRLAIEAKLRQAEQAGVIFSQNEEALELLIENGRCIGMRTAMDNVECPKVIISAGTGSIKLLKGHPEANLLQIEERVQFLMQMPSVSATLDFSGFDRSLGLYWRPFSAGILQIESDECDIAKALNNIQLRLPATQRASLLGTVKRKFLSPKSGEPIIMELDSAKGCWLVALPQELCFSLAENTAQRLLEGI